MQPQEVQAINYTATNLRRAFQPILPNLLPGGVRLTQVALDGWNELHRIGQVSGRQSYHAPALNIENPGLRESVQICITASEDVLQMIAASLQKFTGKKTTVEAYYGMKRIQFEGLLTDLDRIDVPELRSHLIRLNAERTAAAAIA